jgi:hypothetical protein
MHEVNATAETRWWYLRILEQFVHIAGKVQQLQRQATEVDVMYCKSVMVCVHVGTCVYMSIYYDQLILLEKL